MSHEIDQKARRDFGPPPGGDPVARLRHTLAVFAREDDDRVVLTATSRVYRDAPWTGLRMGDLRALLSMVGAESASSVEEGRLGRHIERASERVRSSAAYEAIHGEGRDAPAREEEWQILCADGTVYGWYPTCPPAELVAWVNAAYRKWAPVRVQRRERTVTAWVDVPACEDGGDER